MAVLPERSLPETPALGEQFTTFETKCRSEFDDNGWSAFTDKINEYINDLYVGTRRECITRCNNEMTLKFSGKDAERASMRLDFQRLYGRKQKRYSLQIGAMVGSLLTGITANWAFTDISAQKPSIWPWVILVSLLGLTIILSSLSFIKDMEP
jgi:hypothetical protein